MTNTDILLEDLEDVLDDPKDKVALSTFDVYFLMQGLRTNMVDRLDNIPGPKER